MLLVKTIEKRPSNTEYHHDNIYDKLSKNILGEFDQ